MAMNLAASTSLAQTWQPGPDFWEAPAPRLQAAGVYYLGRVYALGGSPFAQTSDQDGASDYLTFGDTHGRGSREPPLATRPYACGSGSFSRKFTS